MKVIKRDGRVVDFDKSKVRLAVLKAFLDVEGEETPYAKEKAREIANYIEGLERDLSVAEIQTLVEDKLMSSSRKDVARTYINYRYLHDLAREDYKTLMDAVAEKLSASNVQNQNANLDEYSFGGRVGEATDVITKEYALKYCVSDMARKNHLSNEIYIHDLNSYAVGMHNCCRRSTKFITKNGVRSFEDYCDGDEVEVLTHTGEFQKAKVTYHGVQHIDKIVFTRGNAVAEEYFTPTHRWLLNGGGETTGLRVGDKVIKPPVPPRFDYYTATEKEKWYWCLGFILGDGTRCTRWSHGDKKDGVFFVRLRLCGGKVRYADRFLPIKHSVKELPNGDLYLTFSSVVGFDKIIPDASTMSRGDMMALMDGLYSADGNLSGSNRGIATSSQGISQLIEEIGPVAGYYISSVADLSGKTANYATRKFTKAFGFIGCKNRFCWTVKSIQPVGLEDVWCLEVEKDHSFVLPNGIVTGNCLSVPLDDLLARGFNTRQTDVRPAQSVNTAFQLVAVLFQLQSLQQFG